MQCSAEPQTQVAINVTVSPPGVEVKVESIVAHPEYTRLLFSVSKGCHSKNVIFCLTLGLGQQVALSQACLLLLLEDN
jgi:hypothetical protein